MPRGRRPSRVCSQLRPGSRVRRPRAHPDQAGRHRHRGELQLGYTTVLNVAFGILAAVFVVRFLRTGGRGMLAMMDMTADEMSGMGA